MLRDLTGLGQQPNPVESEIMWRNLVKLLSLLVPSILLVGFLAVTVCYLNRWDSMVFLTVLPIWFWTTLAIVAFALCWLFFRNTASVVLLCTAILAAISLPEESRSVYRDFVGDLRPEKADEEQRAPAPYRLVSVRCRERTMDAVREAGRLKPDIILVQNAPPYPELYRVASEIFRDSADSFDVAVSDKGTAVLARGEFLLETGESQSSTLHVRWQPGTKKPIIDITNVDLPENLPTWHAWKKKVRGEMTRKRIENRREVRRYVMDISEEKRLPPRLIAGNFGTPAGDDIFRPMKEKDFRDSYRLVGDGWGNTYPARESLLRLQQVWASEGIELEKMTTAIGKHSEQRVVICDFRIAPKRK